MKKVTILIDTREQKNEHITGVLKALGVMVESRKLDYGDYSFTAEGKDFSHSCVIERNYNGGKYGKKTQAKHRLCRVEN